MKKIAITMGLMLLAPLSAVANQTPPEIVFTKCNSFASVGEKPVPGSAKNCWNPELAKPGRVTRPAAPAVAPQANAPTTMMAPSWARDRMMPRPQMAPRASDIRPLAREIKLPQSRNPDLLTSMTVSKHNPVCYTLSFRGFFYQFCLKDSQQ